MKSLAISPRAFRSKFFNIVFGLALLTQQAMGATIFDWGGKYVTTYAAIDGTPTTTGGSSTWQYSLDTKKSPTYSGPAFYGAFSLTNSDGTGTPEFRSGNFGVNPGTTADSIRFSATAPATGSVTMRGLLFFKKEAFAGTAADSGRKVTFDNTSSLTLQLGTSIAATTRTVKMAVYALVGGEWDWYLSLASTASATNPFTISDAGAATWARYSISGSSAPLDAQPGLSAYTILGSSFEDIGAVGLFFNYVQPSGGNASMYLNTFHADANVSAIPEPSVAAFLLGGFTVAAAVRGLKGKR